MKTTLIAALMLLQFDAIAATPAEVAMNKAPMPHALLSASGQKTIVHLARVQGFFKSALEPDEELAQLRTSVESCIRSRKGVRLNPPKIWPQYKISVREDVYIAANRSITYSREIGYGIDYADCSLLEVQNSRADLESALGACQIDLVAKTATGKCDANGHAHAPAPVRLKPQSPAEAVAAAVKSGMAPELAASLKKSLYLMGEPTGMKKTVLGLHCDVWNMPLQDADTGTICLATGGKAFPVTSGTHGGQTVLNLESRVGQNVTKAAVEARLDETVPAAVFAPYLAAGFSVNKTGKR